MQILAGEEDEPRAATLARGGLNYEELGRDDPAATRWTSTDLQNSGDSPTHDGVRAFSQNLDAEVGNPISLQKSLITSAPGFLLR
jgi:hypothetical protein